MALKEIASKSIEACTQELYQLSDEIWKNPELCYEEFKAHDLLTNFLEKKGFTVQRSFTGIKTAFRATFGSGRPNVCVICEYDALPGIGHACGHNLIAEAGIAAGLGLKAFLESPNAPKGTVTVMGTPAEEGGGGKIKLIKNNAFDGIDIAMMVHPAKVYMLAPGYLAMSALKVTYTGKAAHAAAFPWEGVNALDAAVMAYTSISVLRQQMKPSWRVHGVITNGGAKPNIIPEKSELYYYIRGPNRSEVDQLVAKVKACFEAAAKATGCGVEISEPSEQRYDNVNTNVTLAKLFGENWKTLGVNSPMEVPGQGSTDMGNVSFTVPSIHPKYPVGTGEVPHSRDYTSVTNTPEAHKETLVAAKAMAHTCIDVLTTAGLLEKIKSEFEKEVQ